MDDVCFGRSLRCGIVFRIHPHAQYSHPCKGANRRSSHNRNGISGRLRCQPSFELERLELCKRTLQPFGANMPSLHSPMVSFEHSAGISMPFRRRAHPLKRKNLPSKVFRRECSHPCLFFQQLLQFLPLFRSIPHLRGNSQEFFAFAQRTPL